jgi:inhibitor of KinA
LKNYKLTYKLFGSSAILVEWPSQISEDLLLDILAFKDYLCEMELEDAIVGYSSLTLLFPAPITDFKNLKTQLQSLYKNRIAVAFSDRKIWEIPVYYGIENTDLKELSEEKGLSVESIIDKHSASKYLVYFLGFQPGFMYLGGLDQDLHHPRRGNPKVVPKGSVAIGGSQTGVYPFESIGGWNVIGQSPVQLFDPNQEVPCKMKSGDFVKFVPITKSEFENISKGVELKSIPL